MLVAAGSTSTNRERRREKKVEDHHKRTDSRTCIIRPRTHVPWRGRARRRRARERGKTAKD